MTNNKELIRRYLKSVSKKLNCKRSVKSAFIRELKDSVTSFTEDKQAVTTDELYAEFGTPEEISEGFMDRKDYAALLEKAKKTSLRWRLIWIGVAVVALVIILFLVYVIRDSAGTVTVSNAY